MYTREIPREEWPEFLHDFSRQHEGWQVTIEILSKDLGDQVLAHDWSLQGIACDRQSRAGDDSISVIAGDSVEQHITHTVAHPSNVRVAQTEDGMDQGLQIESDNGPTTLVTFRSPMSPEMMDR